MKNSHSIIVIIFSLCILLISVFSENCSATDKIDFGPKIGLNLSTFVNGFDYNRKFAPAIAGFLAFNLTNWFSIQSEIAFSSQKTEFKGASVITTLEPEGEWKLLPFKTTYNLKYISVPILLRFTLPIFKKPKINIFLGPTFGIKINEREQGFRTTENDETISFDENHDYFKDYDIKALGGIGFSFQLGPGKVMIDTHLLRSLVSISKEYKMYNLVNSINVGYAF
jgi:hypothetical protein